MQNPSIVLYGAGRAFLEEKPVPQLESPHDVLVRIGYVGVCGSDVSACMRTDIHELFHHEDTTTINEANHENMDPLTSPRSTSGTTAASANP